LIGFIVWPSFFILSNMPDQPSIQRPLYEDDRIFDEQMRAMSDGELLATMRATRDGLLADGGKLAGQLGNSDEYLDEINAGNDRMEKAIEDERRATKLVEATKQKLEAAADEYLRALNEADRSDRLGTRSKKNGN
jgi:hypothetical protein